MGTDRTEKERLAALRRLEILDTEPEPGLDRLTRLAARVLGTPIALLSLVDEHRQWFKSRVGLAVPETARVHAFCGQAVAHDELLEVNDARTDPRFRDNPLVQGHPNVVFYAGAPLRTPVGALGTLCVIGHEPRALSQTEREFLQGLADIVMDQLELRRRAATAGRQAELVNLAEQLAEVGHWRLRVDDNSVYWSPQVYRIHGVDPGAFVPTLDSAVAAYHPEDRDRVSELISTAIAERRPVEFEMRLVRPTGEIRQVRAIGQPEVSDGGEVRALFGVFHDITVAKELQSRLHHAERMASIGTLAAGVAHEINNPLAYVKANADVLADELHEATRTAPAARRAELAELVEDIQDGARRIQRIVKSLKVFSRHADRELSQVDVASAMKAAARLCRNELRHRAELLFALHPETPPVWADESELVQVFVNLITNAAQALPDSAADRNAVTLRCGTTGEQRVFAEVVDTGQGMSPATLRQAFTPFFTTKTGSGTGLGLSICHGIVTALGGDILAASTVGEGTTVRVELPDATTVAARQTRRPPPGRPEPPATSECARILVVDDEPLVGRSLGRLLRPHQAVVEHDPRAALARLEAREVYDAIVCDVMMPTMSGSDFLDAVTAMRPELASRIVFVTGGAFTAEGAAFVRRHPERVLEKPVDRGALERVLTSVLSPSVRGWRARLPATGRR